MKFSSFSQRRQGIHFRCPRTPVVERFAFTTEQTGGRDKGIYLLFSKNRRLARAAGKSGRAEMKGFECHFHQ
jgi:hypothetical protein